MKHLAVQKHQVLCVSGRSLNRNRVINSSSFTEFFGKISEFSQFHQTFNVNNTRRVVAKLIKLDMVRKLT